MLGAAMYTTIKTLWRKNKNKSEIVRQTGHDWKTVDKVIKNIESGQEVPIKRPHPRLLDKYKEQILEWSEQGLSGVRIFEKLQELGEKMAYSTVCDYLLYIKPGKRVFIRIHTEPGEEAQVDFGYVGYTFDNNKNRRKTWVFNMRLSYSRLDYYEKVYDQKVETFIRCHINAFRYFGGVVEYVKIDNLKAAILKANFYEPIYQSMYKNFADHYGFNPLPCRIYSPNDKGKVEAGIKYVKNNFFSGRDFKNEDDLDKRLKKWLNTVCNKRIHGTTKKVPEDVFEEEEKDKLQKLPLNEFKIVKVGTRKVKIDCHISFECNYYSVPFEYVGKIVDIELIEDLLHIYYNNKKIAVHPQAKGKGNFCTNNKHYPKYKILSETEYQEKYKIKMESIGSYAKKIFLLVLQEQKPYWYRTIQGILSLKKYYPDEVINLSCKRALAYNAFKYQIIKNICKNGAYNLPVQEVSYE